MDDIDARLRTVVDELLCTTIVLHVEPPRTRPGRARNDWRVWLRDLYGNRVMKVDRCGEGDTFIAALRAALDEAEGE